MSGKSPRGLPRHTLVVGRGLAALLSLSKSCPALSAAAAAVVKALELLGGLVMTSSSVSDLGTFLDRQQQAPLPL